MSALRSGRRSAGASTPATGCGHLLLASEGRRFTNDAIDRVVALAAPGAVVRVFSVARVHGVAFGMPNPGLLPTKAEWREQRDQVEWAVRRLRRRGLEADGHVLGTRNAAKKIVHEARDHDSEAIVMLADEDRTRLIRGMIWSQEPQRVRSRARVPVHLVRVY